MGSNFDYKIVGKRIKTKREGMRYKLISLKEYEEHNGKTIYIYPAGSKEGKKLSIDKLLIYMHENGLYSFRRQLYIDLEHGDERAFKSVKLEQLISLCEVLQCDLSYIFGLTKFSTKEIQTTHDITGLSENAILKMFRKKKCNRMYSRILSWLIEHDTFDTIISRIDGFLQVKWLQAASASEGHPDKKLDKELTKEEERLFFISHEFTNVVQDIAKKEIY